MRIELADPQTVQVVWPFFRARAKKACEKVGATDFAILERDTLDGTDLAWVVRDEEAIYGLVTTTRYEYALEIVQCVGVKWKYDFLKLLETLEQFARENDLHLVRIYGRPGWRRILKDYKVMYTAKNLVILERAL